MPNDRTELMMWLYEERKKFNMCDIESVCVSNGFSVHVFIECISFSCCCFLSIFDQNCTDEKFTMFIYFFWMKTRRNLCINVTIEVWFYFVNGILFSARLFCLFVARVPWTLTLSIVFSFQSNNALCNAIQREVSFEILRVMSHILSFCSSNILTFLAKKNHRKWLKTIFLISQYFAPYFSNKK